MAEGEGAEETPSAAGDIAFNEAVGLLWYTLFTAQRHDQSSDLPTAQKIRSFNSSSAFASESTAGVQTAKSKTVASVEGDRATPSSSSASQLPAATTERTPATSSVEDEFRRWGDVSWVLLAAHVYVLTRQLCTDLDVRHVVVHRIFEDQFHSSAAAMQASFSKKHASLLVSYAQEEEERAAAAAAVSVASTTTTTAAASGVPVATGSSPLSSAFTPVDGVWPSALRRDTVGTHGSQAPITAGITYDPSSSGTAASSAPSSRAPTSFASQHAQRQMEDRGPSSDSPLPASFVSATAAAAPPSSSSNGSALRRSPPRLSRGGGTAVGGHLDAVLSSPVLPSSSNAPLPLARGGGGSGGARATAATAVNVAANSLTGMPPISFSTPATTAAGGVRGGERPTGSSSSTSSPFPVPAQAAPSVAPGLSSVAPDPLDAPWYTLWCSLPTTQARTQLQTLRFHTPLPLEDFSSLLERFFLVDGADDFLNPVHAATIMEFAGVRSAPYHSIVRAPLSLAEVRRYITESHRQYARAATISTTTTTTTTTTSHHEHGAEGTRTATLAGSGHGLATEEAGRASDTRSPNRSGSGIAGAAAPEFLNWNLSNERRILTIAELERSVWHIAANCVVFNAPESRYPRTARRFALSCVEVIIQYCEKQMAAFLAP
ncbi:hypothetical protein ABB37_08307 [Leptomonas pyrrhocoris]|uniref:Uncharacterized protein n=1 Tax=Leptomonas pyrrhocoris TaxID=157538 RepID=A0A0M9FTJ2_LEPPY|nr:hypothetical protein ABB37_08307 [Leptomonas pyrrhocoris]KPA75775.1 hypothetical protein ABB37_08307 [Leptomonas pyrrhocoris]|eukprot:XP_015654214.1 hypothetical protein ABB37_08307 [Leptomonas pyrrhocoris]